MSDKSLKFSATVDDKALKTFNSSLGEVKKIAEGLNKSLDGINKKMKELGNSMKDIGKSLKNFNSGLAVTGQQAQTTANSVGVLTKNLLAMNAALANAQRMLGAGGGGMGGGGGNVPALAANNPNNGGPNGIVPWATRVTPMGAGVVGGGAGGGGGSPILLPAGGTGSNGFDKDKWLERVDIMNAIGSSLRSIGSAYQSGKTIESANQATIASFRAQELRRLKSGDASTEMLLRGQSLDTWGNNLSGVDRVRAADGRDAANLELGGQAFGAGAQTLSGILSLTQGGGASGAAGSGVLNANTGSGTSGFGKAGQIGKGAGDMYTSFMSGTHGGSAALETVALNTQMQNLKEASPYQQMIQEQLRATAGMRLAASRRIGSNVGGAVGTGAGYGLDMGQSLGYATDLSNQFGSGMTMGKGGLMGRGLNLETYGFDRGAAGQMLGNMSMAHGGGASGNEKASKELEDIFATGLKSGLEDVQFFEKIGQSVAEHAFGHGGASTGTGYGAALMGGLNGKSTMMDVQSNIRGAGGFDQLMGGNNYFKAVGMEIAKNVLGPNANGISVQALGRSSFKELLDGSDQLDSLGISKGQGKQVLQGKLQSMISAYAPKNSLLSNSFRAAGGDLTKMFKTAKGGDKQKLRSAFANMLAESTDEFDYNSGLGFARDIEGMGSSIKGGHKSFNMKKQGDSAAFAQLALEAGNAAVIMKDENRLRQNIVDTMKEAALAFEAIRFADGKEPGYTDQALQALGKLIFIITGNNPYATPMLPKTPTNFGSDASGHGSHRIHGKE